MTSKNETSISTHKQVKVLARGIQILQLFVPDNPWLSNHEIASRTQLPRPTVSRLTAVLFGMGLLECSVDNGKYRLAVLVASLGHGLFDDDFLWRSLRPTLTAFAEKNGGVAVLSKRIGLHMFSLEACQSPTALIQININRESRLDLMRSAVGRAWYHSAQASEQADVRSLLAERFRGDREQLELIESGLLSATLNEDGVYLGVGNLESGINGLGARLTLKGLPSQYVLGIAGATSLYSEPKLNNQLMSEFMALKNEIECFIDGAVVGVA